MIASPVYYKILIFLNDLIIPFIIGVFFKKITLRKTLPTPGFYLSSHNIDKLINLNIFLLIPLITSFSFWTLKIEKELLFLPFIGLLMQAIPGSIGFVIVKYKYQDPLKKGSYILSSFFANRSIIGILSVFIIYGEEGYAYSRLTMMFGAFVYYAFGFTLAKYYFEKSISDGNSSIKFKDILFSKNQLPTLGILAGLLLNISGIERPSSINHITPYLVHLSAYFFLIPIGFSTNFCKLNKYIKDAMEISFIRFFILPALIYIICKKTNLHSSISGTLLILAATPASVGAVIAAKINKLNIDLPMAVYIYSSVAYMMIIFPIILLLVN